MLSVVGLIPELSKVFTVVGLSIMWESGFNIIEKYSKSLPLFRLTW